MVQKAYGGTNGAKPCDCHVPINEHPIASRSGSAEELHRIGKIDASAPRRENAVIERDVGVDVARENQSRHEQIGAHQANSRVVRAQAMGELLRQDN